MVCLIDQITKIVYDLLVVLFDGRRCISAIGSHEISGGWWLMLQGIIIRSVIECIQLSDLWFLFIIRKL